MNYTNPLFLIPLLVGIVFIITGFITQKFPPKKINHLYGYRTKTSMKSKERWDFAQKYSSKLMIYCGIILLIIALLVSYLKVYYTTAIFTSLALLILSILVLFIKTEKAIKQNFKNEN